MKRKILAMILILTCIVTVTCNMDVKPAYASNHVHTDACYYHVQYNYTGGIQTFTAPEDGDYILECWGAQGGSTSYAGGLGGYVKGTKHLAKGETLYVNVGGQGSTNSGGYNGGGAPGNGGQGGGGATDIRTTPDDYKLLQVYNRTDYFKSFGPIDLVAGKTYYFEVNADYTPYIHPYIIYGGVGMYYPISNRVDNKNNSACSLSFTATTTAANSILYFSTDYNIYVNRIIYSTLASDNRIMVAGAGGGAGYITPLGDSWEGSSWRGTQVAGGNGGGLVGSNVHWDNSGGPQTAINITGGMAQKAIGWGVECYGLSGTTGGGAGWYGGFSGTGGVLYSDYSYFASGAAGGSSYYGGVSNGSTQAGVNYGNGKAMISSTIPVCAAATIAPQIGLNNMSSDTILTESNTAFCPQVKVYDNENDILSCKYYLDGSSTASGTVTANQSNPAAYYSFPNGINAQTLSEGTHTIKVTAEDGMAPTGESSLTFMVDKSPPIVSSINVTNTSSSIKLDVAASDAVAGLAGSAYRYTIGGIATDWLTTPSYTKSSLASNTSYNYTVEVRDSAGHITTKTGAISTKAGISQITANALTGGDIQTVIKDTNPAGTEYLIKVGSQYADSDGTLIASEKWITPAYDPAVSGKKLILTGLSPDTAYKITVSAKNNGDGTAVIGGSVTAVTAPELPTDLKVSNVKYGEILLNWSTTKGAVSYELKRQAVTTEGIVTDTKLVTDIITNHYSDTDLSPYQKYRYYIRSRNQYGTCTDWSAAPISVKAIPQKPAKVTDIESEAKGSGLDITWAPISGAVGYETEVSYDGKIWTGRAADNKLHFDTKVYDCPSSIRVRAYNVSDDSSPSDPSLWSNAGDWSISLDCYTGAAEPTLDEIKSEQVMNDSVVITWAGNGNPPSVQYVLGIYKDGALLEERTITGNPADDSKLTQLITGLDSETDYKFRMRAVNSTGNTTDWSNEVGITTLVDSPALVTGLCATAKSDRVTLSWNASLRAQTYTVERDGKVIADHIAGTGYTDKEVTADTEYAYRVKAVNITGESGWSQKLIKKTPGELPAAPSVTVVTDSAISLEVKWTPQSGVTGYDVEADGKVYDVGMNSSYAVDGLTPGSTHSYRVRARNDYGNSEWSESITTTLAEGVPVIAVPETPVLQATVSGSALVVLSWNDTEGATVYQLEADNSIRYTGSGTQYHHTSLLPGSTHTYRVRAGNQSGYSNWSEPITATLTEDAPVIAVPETPVLQVTVSGSALVVLSWNDTEGATVYQLEADNSIRYTGSGTQYHHTSLLPGSTHTYRVRAGNQSGYSNWSEPITAQTIVAGNEAVLPPVNIIKIVPISVPTNLSVKEENGKIRLNWYMDGPADFYEVEVGGIVYATTQGTEYDFNKDLFCVERAVRVRACRGTDKGDWSLALQVCNTLSKSEEFKEGEEFSVLLPVKQADKGKYKFTLEYDPNEIELLDACKATPNAETMSVYLKQFKLQILITQEGERDRITYIFNEGSSKWTGLVGSLRFRSKVSGNITLLLGVAER